MYKSAVIGFSYLAGLILASFLPAFMSFLAFAILAVFGILCLILKRNSYALASLTLSIAVVVQLLYNGIFVLPLEQLHGDVLQLEATVLEVESLGDVARFVVAAEIDGKQTKMTLFSSDNGAEKGDKLKFQAELDGLKDTAAFSQKSYYAVRGIYLKAKVKGEVTLVKSETKSLMNHIENYAEHIKSTVQNTLSGEEGDFIAATFFGDSSALDTELKSTVKRTGLSHLLAVSGLHLSLTGNIIMLMMNATSLKNKRYLKLGILTLTVLFFMVFYGFSPSVLRSGIMLLIFYAGDFFRRKTHALSSIGLALFLILLPAPYGALDVGLLLSIAGTFGVAVVGDGLIRRLQKSRFMQIKPLHTIVEIAVGTFCATLCTLPITMLVFESVSLVSILTNVLVTPLFNIVLFLLIIHTMTGGFLAAPLLLIPGLLVKLILWLLRLIDQIPYGYITLEYDFIPMWLAISVVFIGINAVRFKKYRYVMTSVMLCVAMCVVLIVVEREKQKDSLFFTVLSDGKAGAVIFQKDNYTAIFIHAESPKLANTLGTYLAERNIKQIYLLSSPKVADSTAVGLAKLTQTLKCKKLILSERVINNADYDFVADRITPLDFKNDDGILAYEITENETFINANDIEIVLSSVKQERPQTDIAILSEYKLSFPPVNSEMNIFLNSRQAVEGENNFNAYYDEISYRINTDKTLTPRRIYALY